MAAGDELSANFFFDELRITGHPAADRLEKQFAEWSRRRVHAETPRKLVTFTNSPAIPDELRAIRDHYYNVILPAQAAAYIKPYMRVSIRILDQGSSQMKEVKSVSDDHEFKEVSGAVERCQLELIRVADRSAEVELQILNTQTTQPKDNGE